MNPKPIKIGEVTLYSYTAGRKYPMQTLRWRVGRQVYTRSFSDYDRAVREAHTINNSISEGMSNASRLSAEELSYFVFCKELLGGEPLHEVIKDYLARLNNSPVLLALNPEIVGRYFDSLKENEFSERHISSAKYCLGAFSNYLAAQKTQELSTAVLESFLASREWGAHSKTNMLKYVRAFVVWGSRMGLWGEEAIKACDGVVRPKLRAVLPEVFSPLEMAKLLTGASEQILPYLVLGAFTGIRSAELERLQWEDIDWEAKEIWLTPDITKTNRRRAVPLPDVALEWLSLVAQIRGPIVPAYPQILTNKLAKETGVKWKANGLRKSFVSYHLALHGNTPLTALISGHDVDTLERNYKALVRKSDAHIWLEQLNPSTARSMVESGDPTPVTSTSNSSPSETDSPSTAEG